MSTHFIWVTTLYCYRNCTNRFCSPLSSFLAHMYLHWQFSGVMRRGKRWQPEHSDCRFLPKYSNNRMEAHGFSEWNTSGSVVFPLLFKILYSSPSPVPDLMVICVSMAFVLFSFVVIQNIILLHDEGLRSHLTVSSESDGGSSACEQAYRVIFRGSQVFYSIRLQNTCHGHSAEQISSSGDAYATTGTPVKGLTCRQPHLLPVYWPESHTNRKFGEYLFHYSFSTCWCRQLI